MRCVNRHIQRFWEANCRVKFLAPHRRVIKSLQVNDKNFGEAINGQVFLNVDFSLAFRAFKPGLKHALRLNKFVEALA